MPRFWLTMIGFVPLFLLGGSNKQAMPLARITPAALRIEARPIVDALAVTQFPFRFVKAWRLSSANHDFGSVSAMLREQDGFITISDHGAVARFKMTGDGKIVDASIAPLPIGCAADELKTSRDAESMSRDGRSNDVLIGFEWSNTLCRSNRSLTKAVSRVAPLAMRSWPVVGGAEALVTLRDGRTLVFAERTKLAGRTSPILIFDREPTAASTRVTAAVYRPPSGFRPTDAAQLPDGRLVIVNRRYEFPLTFSAVITLIPLADVKNGATLSGKVIALLDDPSISENYEAIAVSQSSARTFVWVMSDDNFIALQSTNLLLFEVLSAAKTP